MTRRSGGSLLVLVATAGSLDVRQALAQPCQQDPDCAHLSGPCSNGVCSQNQCLRQPINEDQPCTAPNICITNATCSSGFCVGTWILSCCTVAADCNDYNPCTNDSCNSNVCTHTNRPPGTPCGSSVVDECTNADVCDNAGVCMKRDAPDGLDCGGPDCLGGQCGPTTYRAQVLPEGSFVGSIPRGIAERPGNDLIISGRVADASLVEHAAVWSCDLNGTGCTLTQLPEGGAGTSSANAVACNTAGTCRVGGTTAEPMHQPAVWTHNGGSWAAETLPLPAGATGGAVVDVLNDRPPLVWSLAGDTIDAVGFRKPTYWERDGTGVWGVFLLPDFGIPEREGMATGIEACPDGTSPALCAPGARLITGWVEDGFGFAQPVVWQETDLNTRAFDFQTLPLPGGALGLGGQDLGCSKYPSKYWGWLNVFGGGDQDVGLNGGTVVLGDGTTRNVVWKTADFVGWTSTVLPPLDGHQSSERFAMRKDPLTTFLFAFASSYPAGSDSHTAGVATQWTLDAQTLALISGPTDMSDRIAGLPPGCALRAFSNPRTNLPGKWDMSYAVCPSPVAGTPQPHAVIAVTGPPAGIPAVTTWGLVVMALLVCTAGTIVMARATVGQPAARLVRGG